VQLLFENLFGFELLENASNIIRERYGPGTDGCLTFVLTGGLFAVIPADLDRVR
jgi:hypothetical protein